MSRLIKIAGCRFHAPAAYGIPAGAAGVVRPLDHLGIKGRTRFGYSMDGRIPTQPVIDPPGERRRPRWERRANLREAGRGFG